MMKNPQTIAFLLFAFAIETAYSAEAYTHSYKDPSDCTTDCVYSVMISTDGTQATIKLSTNASGMVALGFSSDMMMGQDDVVGCYRKTSDDTVALVDAWNPSGRSPNVEDTINNLNGAKSSGTYLNGTLSCTLVRDLMTNDTAQDVNWNDPWYLFYAFGSNTGAGPGLPKHTTTPMDSEEMIEIAPTATTAPPPTTPTPLTSVNIDFTECSTDGYFCYRSPADCSVSTCQYGLIIKTDGTKATIKLSTTADGWIALGFSMDKAMGEDDVVGCARSSGGDIFVKDTWNPNGRSPNVKDTQDNIISAESLGTLENGTLKCQIVRNLVSSDTTQDYNWNNPMYHLYAYRTAADATDGAGFLKHSVRPTISTNTVDLVEEEPTPTDAGATLVFAKAYGILILLAWLGHWCF